MEKFVQVGVMALRNPDGDFLPAAPVHAKVKAEAPPEGSERQKQTFENRMVAFFANKHREYVRGVEALEGGAGKRGVN